MIQQMLVVKLIYYTHKTAFELRSTCELHRLFIVIIITIFIIVITIIVTINY